MRTLRAFIFLAIMSFSAQIMASGGGTLKGNLVDEFNQPVPMAHVFYYEGGELRGALTDMDGKFTIKPIISGKYDFFFTCIGFDTLKMENVRIISDRITMLRNQVLPMETLDGVDIIAYVNPIIKIDEPSVIEFHAEDIKHIPNRNSLTGMIATITPGVYQASEGDPLQFRGSRKSASVYFIDGVKMTGVENAIPSTAVGNIRVYAGGIPAMYGDITGGVVVIETKSFLGWYKKENHKVNL
jgi:hypothetical protein